VALLRARVSRTPYAPRTGSSRASTSLSAGVPPTVSLPDRDSLPGSSVDRLPSWCLHRMLLVNWRYGPRDWKSLQPVSLRTSSSSCQTSPRLPQRRLSFRAWSGPRHLSPIIRCNPLHAASSSMERAYMLGSPARPIHALYTLPPSGAHRLPSGATKPRAPCFHATLTVSAIPRSVSHAAACRTAGPSR
jgi:hypothetical protein